MGGVILYDETIRRQPTTVRPSWLLASKGVVPGSRSTRAQDCLSPGEKGDRGLDGLRPASPSTTPCARFRRRAEIIIKTVLTDACLHERPAAARWPRSQGGRIAR